MVGQVIPVQKYKAKHLRKINKNYFLIPQKRCGLFWCKQRHRERQIALRNSQRRLYVSDWFYQISNFAYHFAYHFGIIALNIFLESGNFG